MKRIIIDLDDVITTAEGWLYVINKFLGTDYKEENFKEYYLQDVIPEERKGEFVEFFRNFNTYDECNLRKDAVEVIRRLNEKYEIYICSAYVYRDDPGFSGKALNQKFDFLFKNFPFIDPHRFIFVDKKSILDCDIRIDDKETNLENAETKLLFTAYHNKNVPDEELKERGITRVNNWADIAKILL